MKLQKIEINTLECNLNELAAEDKELVEKAIQATNNAYAKYSHFHVGAAARLSNGEIIIGANQENAAYPSGLCAERTAVFAAQAQHPDQPIVALAIAAKNKDGMLHNPVSPCGACRQVLLEIEDRYKKDMKIFLYGEDKVICLNSTKDLLPFCFVENNMKG